MPDVGDRARQSDGSSPPRLWLLSALMASAGALAEIELFRASRLAHHTLARTPSTLDRAHTLLADVFVAATLAAVVLGWRLASGELRRRLSRRPGWRGGSARDLVVSSLGDIALPGFALAVLLLRGTSAWSPNATAWLLLAVAVVASAPSLWLVRWVDAFVGRWGASRPRWVWAVALLLAVLGGLGWAGLASSFGHRYGRSHLVTFGALAAYLTVVFAAALRASPVRALSARHLPSAGLGVLLLSATGFLAPPSAAARELFYAESPTRWFGTALAGLGSDADRDGFHRPLGFSAGDDCDDTLAIRNPRRPELLGNGIDENCFDGDQKRPLAELMGRSATPSMAPVADRGRAVHDARPSNLLVILLDSWRFDRESPSGVSDAAMPALAALASEALVFADYRTCAPRTKESLGDLYSGGLAPSRRTTSTSAIQRITQAGVHTVDIASRWRHEYDSVRGWGRVVSVAGSYGEFGDPEVVSETVRLLRERPALPFFFAVQLLEAHEPYSQPSACAGGTAPFERYRCALRHLDARLAELVAALRDAGLLESTVLAVSADHGEEFGEHGGRYHASTVYDEVLHVPLVLRIPGRGHELVGEPMSCFDLLPTLLGAAHITVDASFLGTDYSSASRPVDATQLSRTRAMSTLDPFEPRSLAVVYRHFKLRLDRHSGLHEYFDLAADPREQRPLAALSPGTEQALLERMDAWLSELARQSSPEPSLPPSSPKGRRAARD